MISVGFSFVQQETELLIIIPSNKILTTVTTILALKEGQVDSDKKQLAESIFLFSKELHCLSALKHLTFLIRSSKLLAEIFEEISVKEEEISV